MSVLLDALKKAAEEKKAVNSGSESNQETSDALQNSESVVEKSDKELSLEAEGKAEEPNDDLPLFDLKLSETVEETEPTIEKKSSETSHATTEGLTLKLSDNDSNSEAEAEDSGLISLMESLDEEKVGINTADNANQEVSSNQNSYASLNNLSTEDEQVVNPSVVQNDQEPKPENFSWSLDELPGYNQQDKAATSSDDEVYVTNPILVNGENVPPKVTKKYATSTRVILSLIVILLFIGIGFYGLLYYQEQNEELEFSMRKYNLSKMTLPSQANNQNNQKASAPEESDKGTNLVSDKVLALGNTIKDAVEKNVIQPLSNQSSTSTVDIETVQLDDLNANNKPLEKKKDSINKVAKPVVAKTKLVKSHKTSNYRSKRSGSTSSNNGGYKQSLSKGIVVTTSTRSDIAKAYSAYDSQNYTEAKRLFSDVIKKQPSNINALLGLGGVSVANRDFYKAINLYQKVLDKDPNNLYAFESIANLSGRVSLNNEWSSELASMISNHPKSAVLQYAQGNIFAEKSDWLKAQKHYFNALVLDSKNPDYMLNLAISFDHLGKYKLADKYYTQALGFSDTKQVSFDKKQVKDRLISIRQFIVKGY